MKKSLKKLPALLLTLLLALSLAACGGADDDDDTDLTDFTPMTVEELTGGWIPTRAPTTTGRGTAGWASARLRSWTTGP